MIEAFTYKVMPVGNGSMYGWNKFNAKGEIVESSLQSWPSAMDAEKALRSFVSAPDVIEVQGMSNVNPEANRNVVVVVPPKQEEDRFNGMTPVPGSVSGAADPDSSVPVVNGPEAVQAKEAARVADQVKGSETAKAAKKSKASKKPASKAKSEKKGK